MKKTEDSTCGVTGWLMILGCVSTVVLTVYQGWDGWTFGGVYALIMTGGKAMKIAGSKFGGKK